MWLGPALDRTGLGTPRIGLGPSLGWIRSSPRLVPGPAVRTEARTEVGLS